MGLFLIIIFVHFNLYGAICNGNPVVYGSPAKASTCTIFRLFRNLQNSSPDCSWKVFIQKESILAESHIIVDKLLDQRSGTVMEIYSSAPDDIFISKSSWTMSGGPRQKFVGGCRVVLSENSLGTEKFPITEKEIERFSLRPEEDYYIFLADCSEENTKFVNPFKKSLKYKLTVCDTHEDRNENVNKCNLRGISMSPFSSETNSMEEINLDWLCSDKQDEKIDWNSIFLDFTTNYRGYEMKISVPTKIKGFIEITKRKDGSWIATRGKEMSLLESAMSKLNFTTHLFQSSGLENDERTRGGTGVQLPNGSWTGCVGDVLSDRADFSPTCGPSFSRIHVTDFTRYVGHGWLIFVMGRPAPIFSWTVIFRTFELGLWIAMVVICTLVVLFMVFLTKYSVSFHVGCNGYDVNAEKSCKIWSWKKTAQYIFATLLGQDVPKPKYEPVRVLYIFWLFFALIISTIYVSKLVGYLTFPEVATVPHTFQDLATSDYKAGMHGASRGGIGEAHLKSSFGKLFKKMDLDPGDYNCLANGLISQYACVIYKPTADYMIQKDFISSNGQHGFIYSSDSTLYVITAWMMKKRSIHRQSFSDIIRWAYDSGLLDKWEKIDHSQLRKARLTNIEPKAINTAPTKTSTPSPLTIHHCTASFVIVLIGNFAAIITFFIERIHKYFQNVMVVIKDSIIHI